MAALAVASSFIQGAGAAGTKRTARKNSAPEDIARVRRTLGLPALQLPAEEEPESSSFSDHSSDVGGGGGRRTRHVTQRTRPG